MNDCLVRCLDGTNVNWSGNAPIHRLAGFGEVDRRIDKGNGLG